MSQRLALISIVVRDYDEAIAWFTQTLGFDLVEDTKLSDTKRWVIVGPSSGGTRLLLARADGDQQQASIGNQTGGRVFLFLETDDFDRDQAAMKARGVRFLEDPRREAYGAVAVFEDVCGNRWDLIEYA